jgi:hypothetical protein
MSATGFQRRRRELALQKEQQVVESNEKKDEGSGINETGNNDNGNASDIVTKINLAELSKAELFKFAGKRKLLDKSLKELEPAAFISAIIERARGKIIEANLKTAEEAASLTEDELFALFDTIGK